MSILTKEECDAMRDRIVSRHYRAAISVSNDIRSALDTIDALEAERDETWGVLARAGIPDEDEQIELPLAVERLWLAYEGANHNFSKYHKRVDALEAERDQARELAAFLEKKVEELRAQRDLREDLAARLGGRLRDCFDIYRAAGVDVSGGLLATTRRVVECVQGG